MKIDFVRPGGSVSVNVFEPRVREDPWEVFLKRITYKPGWQLSFDYDIDRDRRCIIVEMRVEDSYKPGQMITVSTIHQVEPFEILPEGYHEWFIRKLLTDLEMHELDEWFKKDGKLVNDPHAIEKINV